MASTPKRSPPISLALALLSPAAALNAAAGPDPSPGVRSVVPQPWFDPTVGRLDPTDTVSWSDAFEPAQGHVPGSGIQGTNGWLPWFGAAPDHTVTNTQSCSGPGLPGTASVELGPQMGDCVQLFNQAGGGGFLSAMTYIPSGSTGIFYIILMNQYDHAGVGPNDWSVQCEFDATTGLVSGANSANPAAAPVPIVFDQWIPYTVCFDIANNKVNETYNGQNLGPAYTWFGPGNLFATVGTPTFECFDLYSAGISSAFVDNICIHAPSPSRADCNGDAACNIFDYICFGNFISAQDPCADLDGNCTLNIFDWIAFGNLFNSGCSGC